MNGDFSDAQLDAAAGEVLGPAPEVSDAELERAAQGVLQDEERQRDERIGTLFDVGLTFQPDARARVLELARRTRVPADVIEQRLPDFEASWRAAQFEPRKWREANPELARLVLDNPEAGTLVVKDEQVPWAIRQLRQLAAAVEEANLDAEFFVKRQEEIQAAVSRGASREDIRRMQEEHTAARQPEVARKREQAGATTRQRLVLEDAQAKEAQALTGLARAQVPWMAFRQGMEQQRYAELGFSVLTKRLAGADTWEEEKRLVDLEARLVPRDFGAGAWEQALLVEPAQMAASQVEVLKGGGLGVGAGAVLGALPGLAMRNPAVARAGARVGARAGGKLGATGASFVLEAGSSFLGYRKEMTEEEAAGAAIIYGAAASGIEGLSFGATEEGAKAFLGGLLKDAAFRQLATRVAKAWAKKSASEGLEEFLQTVAQDVTGYLARSKSAGELQAADPISTIEAGLDAARVAATSAALLGAGGPVTAVTVDPVVARMRRAASLRAGQQVAQLAGLAQTPSARAAPAAVAKAVEEATAAGGEPLTSLYVDTERLVTLFQDAKEDVDQAVEELLGPEGPAKLREAIATGAKLQVPMADYLEKWGTKPLAQQLADYTTTRPDRETVAELRARRALPEQVAEDAQALAQQYEAEGGAPPASQAEQRLVDAVQQQLSATGVYTAAQAKQAVSLTRAFLRTQAERFGVEADELFRQYTLSVEREGAQQAPPAAPAAPVVPEADVTVTGPGPAVAAQGAVEVAEPGSRAAVRQAFAGLPVEQRRQEYFTDKVTGLLNRRGFEAAPRDAARPVLAEWEVEGGKWLNDVHGHEALDGALRTMAWALQAKGISDGAKLGGSVRAWVANPQQAKSIARTMQKALGGALRVTTATAPAGATLDETLEAAGLAHRDLKSRETQAGRLAPRGEAPSGLSPEAAAQLAEQLKRPPPVETPIQPAQRATFMLEADDFAAIHEDTVAGEPTGLLSGDGFARAREVAPKRFVASADMRGLRAMNEAFGKAGADQVLLAFSKVLGTLGQELDAAHPHGDEFAAQADSREELEGLFVDVKEAADRLVLAMERPDGSVVLQVGIPFAHGVGETTDEADRVALPAAKSRQGAVSAPRVLSADDAAREIEGLGRTGDHDVRWLVPGDAEASARVEAQAGVGARGGEAAAGGVELQVAQPPVAPAPERLQQPGGGGPRGYTDFLRRGAERLARVVLREGADLSTYLHEVGHVFLAMFGDLAERPDAPQQVKDDWAATLSWMGIQDRAGLKVEQHEKWAKAFEAYLMGGEAPSKSLRGAFLRFRRWLISVYRSIASLGGAVDPQIRGVFDRLLAVDDEVQRARRRMRIQPLWQSAEDAGMTPEQWADYLREQELATSHVERQAELRAAKEQLERQDVAWQEERKKLREEALAEFDARPEARARRYVDAGELDTGGGDVIRTGPVKLDRAAVEAALGPAEAKRLFGQRLVASGGESPDTVADIFGFPSGAKLLEALRQLPEREAWAEEQADARMAQRHPELLADRQRLQDVVAKGLHGDYTLKWLMREWRALRAKTGARDEPPLAAVRRAAELIAAKRLAGELSSYRAMLAEGRAASKAMEAAAQGDFAQAYTLQQQRILNHFLYKELERARDEREAFLKLAGELRRDKARGQLGKAAPQWRDAVDQLLEAAGLRERLEREEPPASLDEAVAALERYAVTVGFDLAPLKALVAQPRPWKQLSVGEVRNLHAALRNFKAAAAARNTALVGLKRMDRELVTQHLVDEARANLKSKGPASSSVAAESWLQAVRGGVAGIDGALLKPETMVGWLGGGDVKSWWHQAIIEPLQRAKALEADTLKTVVKPIIAAFEAVPEEVRRRFMDRVDGAALFPGHRGDIAAPSRRFELLMLALHAGNESNLERLTGGRSITPEQVQAAINLLSKEEMDWVQSVWDAAESLWPQAKALEERDSGVAPPKVEARPVPTRWGEYRGGYFPAVYDRRVEPVGERQAAQTLADLMDPSYSRPGTARSHLKARADSFSGVLALEPGVIYSHLAQVAHDIAYREAVKSVGQLILEPEVQAVLKERLGDERARVWLQWVKDVGQMRGAQLDAHVGALNRIVRKLRGNSAVALLGWSTSIAMGDISNLAVGATLLGKKHWAAGLYEYLRNPLVVDGLVGELSGEMRYRRESLLQDFHRQVKSLTARGPLERGPLAWFRDHAFTFFEWTDRVTATPIWLGAFRQALAEGREQDEAVAFADAVVRKAFPSHSAVDQAALLRDKGFWGMSTMFYGYLSTMYQLERDIVQPVLEAEGAAGVARALPRAAGRLMALWVAFGVLSELLTGRGPEPGDGDDEEEGWTRWFLRKLLVAPLQSLPGPLASSIESGALGRRPSVRAAPGFALVDELGRAAYAAATTEDGARAFAAITRALGLAFGIPVRPLTVQGRFAVDVLTGEQPVEGPGDVLSGALYGAREGQPLNPVTALARDE